MNVIYDLILWRNPMLMQLQSKNVGNIVLKYHLKETVQMNMKLLDTMRLDIMNDVLEILETKDSYLKNQSENLTAKRMSPAFLPIYGKIIKYL